ncbi:sigma-70 family RNA polymerase sigma factor [Hungatella hathewayi]
MARPYRIPDFKKLYPEASDEVIAVLKTTERKMQYQEYDLKAEQTIIDPEGETVGIIPGREDSYERLLEQNVQFYEESSNVEEMVIRRMEVQQLHKALTFLSKEERDLIDHLYFKECTEREIAAKTGISQNAVNKRRQKILNKLRKIFEKI